ncbi:MAG: hypothetical protein ACI8WB_005212 [Phenylobacterium sp.]|jgi:hypothetical protein
MNNNVLTTLSKVLLNIDNLPWEYALYIPSVNAGWSRDIKCMVLDPEETEDPDDDPDEAKNNGMKYALGISDVQDVMENILAQKRTLDLNLQIKALKYYYDNDAFIEL